MSGTGLGRAAAHAAALLGIMVALASALAACGEKPEPDPATGLPPGAPSAAEPAFGFNDGYRQDNPGIELLGESDASFGRTPLSWTAVESEPGNFDWSTYDALEAKLSEQGVAPLWAVTDAPCWATGRADCVPNSASQAPGPEFYDDYGDFVVSVAERYPDSFGVELWNEPNIPNFWQPTPDPVAYRGLVDAAVAATGDSGTEVPVILAGLSPADAADAARKPGKLEAGAYLERVLGSGDGPPGVDVIALHPYSLDPGADPVGRTLAVYDREAGIAKRAAPGLPIWVTEVGLSTAGRNAVTPLVQARGLAEIYAGLADRGVPVIGIHRLFDQADPAFPFEAGFGVVGVDGSPKPAYCAIAAVVGAEPSACPALVGAG